MIPAPRQGPSPFLEGTCIQYAWDSTSLGALKRCPRLYQLSIIEGWRAKNTSFHLEFGIFYTEALELYEKLRVGFLFDESSDGEPMGHEEALAKVVEDSMIRTWIIPTDDLGLDTPEGMAAANDASRGAPWTTEDSNKNRYTLLRSIIWKLDEFQNDPAETVVAEDGTPLVERSFSFELDWGPHFYTGLDDHEGHPIMQEECKYVLCGHLDRVVSFIGQTFVSDNKTTKTTVSDYYFDQYEPNNQMSLYTLAGKIVFEAPISGVMIDAAQIAVGFTRFARGITYRTQAQLDEWMRDLRYWLRQAEGYATDGYWPMNDTACFNCEFNRHGAKICAKDPSVRQSFLESHFTQEEPWNPLLKRN